MHKFCALALTFLLLFFAISVSEDWVIQTVDNEGNVGASIVPSISSNIGIISNEQKDGFNGHKEGEYNILYKDENWQWAKGAGGTDYDFGAAIVMLSDESMVVTGSFSGSATFGKGESCETVLVSDGGTDIFVARYNTDGTSAWAKRAGGTSGDMGQGIVTLSGDSFLVTGYFSGSATFGKGESCETVLVSDGSTDIFVAKHNSDGTIAWAKRAGGVSGDVGQGIVTLSDDSFLVTGSFEGIADFGTYPLTSQGDSDVFVAKIGTEEEIVCGDANGDETVNIADASFIINAIFFGGTQPDPEEAADANDDGTMNIADASYLINWIFFGGNPPCEND